MGHWLASERSGQEAGVLTRFDAAYWTVDFPRPMMASVVTTAADALRVDCVFYRRDDLAGLIWAAEDKHDHPLLRYATDRDFRGCRLSFRWRSGGVRALDAVHGPVLTIEGRDAAGAARAWYVRLWNYAVGDPEDAVVAIDFADVDGGFLLPGEADPVWAGDVDRMFVSLVPPGYDAGDAPLAAPAEGWVELSAIRCDGPGSVLTVGDVVVPEHGLGICSGYDDSYHLTPARLLHNALRLGYRGDIVHYVGMSHYFRLERAGGGLFVSLAGGVLNAACAAWHRDFAMRARALGYGVIWSLSYELFDAHCWGDWKQRASDGSPALTGWVPPSTLLSPAHPGAMAYLQAVARAFVGIAVVAGLVPKFQVGEPWWWVTPGHRICLYDAAAKVALGGDPVVIDDVRGDLDAARRELLDRAGALLAASTAALGQAARAAGAVQVLLLAYLPTILDPAAPQVKRANLPVGWARPAFDVLQLEDYDWATTGNVGASVRAVAAAETRLGYPVGEQQYFAGFVLRGEDRGQWTAIVAAAQRARTRGVAAVFLPSAIVRDDTAGAPALEVGGALSHRAVAERDLLAGRYDGARISVFAWDWSADVATPVAGGRIGSVATARGGFTAELLGVEVALDRAVVETTSPGCRATLGDARCRVPMAERRRVVRVSAQAGNRLVLAGGGVGCAGGRLRWIGGANGGLAERIVAGDATGVVLARVPAFEGAGALVEVGEGCDGTLATCRDRFGNVANFRGEPHLPGIDLLTRYPGA